MMMMMIMIRNNNSELSMFSMPQRLIETAIHNNNPRSRYSHHEN